MEGLSRLGQSFFFTEVLRKGDKNAYMAMLDCAEVKKMTTKKEQKICWS